MDINSQIFLSYWPISELEYWRCQISYTANSWKEIYHLKVMHLLASLSSWSTNFCDGKGLWLGYFHCSQYHSYWNVFTRKFMLFRCTVLSSNDMHLIIWPPQNLIYRIFPSPQNILLYPSSANFSALLQAVRNHWFGFCSCKFIFFRMLI